MIHLFIIYACTFEATLHFVVLIIVIIIIIITIVVVVVDIVSSEFYVCSTRSVLPVTSRHLMTFFC